MKKQRKTEQNLEVKETNKKRYRNKRKPLMPNRQPSAEDLRVSLIVLQALPLTQKHHACK